MNTTDRRPVTEGRVWSLPVAVLQPVRQGLPTMLRGGVKEPVAPLPGHGLVEALDLAVGLRPPGFDQQAFDLLLSKKPGQPARAGVSPGVVGHQALDRDPLGFKELQCPLGEAENGLGVLAAEDLGVGQA